MFATRGEIEVMGRPVPAKVAEILPSLGAMVEGPAAYPHLSGRADLGLLDAVLRAHPGRFDWTPPQAGVLGFPRYTGPDGAEAFAATLVRDTGILVVPSTVYRSALGHVPADRLRIGFGRALAEEALQRLEAWLADGERC